MHRTKSRAWLGIESVLCGCSPQIRCRHENLVRYHSLILFAKVEMIPRNILHISCAQKIGALKVLETRPFDRRADK